MILPYRVFGILIAIFLVIILIRPVASHFLASERKDLNEKDLNRALAITCEEARYPYLLGLIAYRTGEQQAVEKAVDRYRNSLTKNIVNGQVWIALARAYSDLGKGDYAEYSFKKAAYVGKGDKNIQWEAGVFLLNENKVQDAIVYFRQYIHLMPADQASVYSLFYTIGVGHEYILKSLVLENYSSYLEYLKFLMANGLVQESEQVWKKMASWNRSRVDYLTYIDFLINSENVESAYALWGDYTEVFGLVDSGHSSYNLIWNGGFELPVQDGGFDWRIGKVAGVRVFIDTDMKKIGHASLSAQFDGKANPDVYIAQQIVLVEPDESYLLKGRILTDALTTTNGIILEASSYRCDAFVQKSEPVTGTTLWKDVDLEFKTPANCKAMRVGIKREKSEKFDNRISGDVWVDLITLTPERKRVTSTP